MGAVHPFQNFIRARLHRKMQIGHQFSAIGMRLNQRIAHVIWVAGGKADTLQSIDLIQSPNQLRQTPAGPFNTFAVIGIHILAQ